MPITRYGCIRAYRVLTFNSTPNIRFTTMTTLDLTTCKWPAKTGFYSTFTADWPREAGKKVTQWQLAAAHLVYPKKRPGVEQLFIAMGLRDNGVTVDEFMLAGHCK